MDYKGQREVFVGWIKKQLIGIQLKDNGDKQNEAYLDGEKPLDRFFTGFLFPIVEQEDILDSEEEDADEDESVSESENNTKPIKKDKRYIPPSSAGFSFYITGEKIKLRTI